MFEYSGRTYRFNAAPSCQWVCGSTPWPPWLHELDADQVLLLDPVSGIPQGSLKEFLARPPHTGFVRRPDGWWGLPDCPAPPLVDTELRPL